MNMNKENSTTSGSYRISITDNDTHKHIWGARFTKTSFFVTLVSFIVTLSAIIFCIIAFTPVKTFIPGYPDARSKRTAIQNAIKVDSLERVIYRWELYSENLKRAVSGKAPVKIDSIIKANVKTAEYAIDQASFQKQDSLLKERVKAEEQFEISARSRRELPIEGLHFFTPLKGVITQGYDAIHPYIDVTAAEETVVKSTLDGTIIYAGWSEEDGNIIQIQHTDDIISIYKHLDKLLKKTGDKVKAGTPVAVLGNTSSGTPLHFELWHKGETVDPTLYIKF